MQDIASHEAIFAASGVQNVREWLLAVGTVVLAVFTLMLWRSTKRMADKTAEAASQAALAANAARESTEVARQALALESERWQLDLADRKQVHARLVECHLGYDPAAGFAELVCHNRGTRSILRVALHLKIGHDDWIDWDPVGMVEPGGRASTRRFDLDRVEFPTLAAVEAGVLAATTFTDADGRRWLRWTHNETLEAYDGNVTQIRAHWRGGAR